MKTLLKGFCNANEKNKKYTLQLLEDTKIIQQLISPGNNN